MLHLIFAAISGLVFGTGLIIAGMANPAKVLSFLDLAGHWDPSLAMVMAGAIGMALWPFYLARRRRYSLLGTPMQLPVLTRITGRLIAGSALFGAGWGLAGICPGPALVVISIDPLKGAAFILPMLAGILLVDQWDNKTGT
ncbi:DUF6691 family protein [Undibacterium oligocarboniphilum]|uniref:YeeE/YedE family protein n=1 Tax=Undibacterium oligocarboniphilum TaxID=666702 RepID=A0A850QL04_9BURK|nr:DUF6691 family protein [Undibacterium oligocarboniphilum]MBC3869104.1 hypothetical protein [Undibacterium oligocarboniphilum]NVO77084.1 hypothetical protein [Undibacterium oligocarboniphilum]